MKTRCHNCGAVASLDLLVSTHAAGRAFAAALEIPPELKPLMLKYLGLFRPLTRELSFARATTLLTDIIPHIQTGKLTFDRVTTDAPLNAWAWGIEQVLQSRDAGSLKLPLNNHHYLYRIVQGYDACKHQGKNVLHAYGGHQINHAQTVLLNGLPKPVFADKSQRETWDIVMQAQQPGESADETYERIKIDYL